MLSGAASLRHPVAALQNGLFDHIHGQRGVASSGIEPQLVLRSHNQTMQVT